MSKGKSNEDLVKNSNQPHSNEFKQINNQLKKEKMSKETTNKNLVNNINQTQNEIIEMKEERLTHPDGYKYIPLEDGRIQVTEEERVRYLKSKHICFYGVEYENDTEYPITIEDFTECIKEGGVFTQVDMFGQTQVVTKDEIIDFIKENYHY